MSIYEDGPSDSLETRALGLGAIGKGLEMGEDIREAELEGMLQRVRGRASGKGTSTEMGFSGRELPR